MTTATHTATGLLIVKTLDLFQIIPDAILTQTYILGVITANIPDLDVLIRRKIINHRESSISHIPLFWLMVTIPLFATALFFRLDNLFFLTLITFIGIFSHFVLDSLDLSRGIAWLWPYTHKTYAIIYKTYPKPKNTSELVRLYFHQPHLYVDLTACTITALVFLFIK